MFTITRKVNESVVIGRDIVVTVLEVNSDWVRLGIRDPRQTPAYQEHVVYLAEHSDEFEQAQCEFQLQ